MLKLQETSFGKEEILEIMDSLLSGYVSMGKKNLMFEENWTNWLDTKYSTSCNSGSSANLLIYSALRSPLTDFNFEDGDEIIVPAVSWSTTFFPIVQSNLKCKIVDIDPMTLNINPDLIEQAINKKTKAIMIVHLLGSPCDMDKIMGICKKHNLILIEDTCESYGAKWDNKKVGSFGLVSAFSFMFAHHMTTAEGGMISTNDESLNDVIRIKRAHGWIREMKNEERKNSFIKANPAIDERFLFMDMGYNMRMNDIQASMGIQQLKKLDTFIDIRRENHFHLCNKIEEEELDAHVNIIKEQDKQTLSPYSFPIIAKSKEIKIALMKEFEKNGIETRGIAGGNITRQPFIPYYRNSFIFDKLPGADKVHDNGLYIGNNQSIVKEDYEQVISVMKKVLK